MIYIKKKKTAKERDKRTYICYRKRYNRQTSEFHCLLNIWHRIYIKKKLLEKEINEHISARERDIIDKCLSFTVC